MGSLLLLIDLKLAQQQALKDIESDSDSSNSSLQEDNFGGLF
jgi:hypothetical protein